MTFISHKCNQWRWAGIFLIFTMNSCWIDNKQEILLQEVSKTSDLIHCDRIFASDRRSIIELNKVYIQTGWLDTSESVGKYVAIIHVMDKELILDRVYYKKTDNKIIEKYNSKGYILILKLKPVKIQKSIDFEGSFELADGTHGAASEIYGVKNML